MWKIPFISKKFQTFEEGDSLLKRESWDVWSLGMAQKASHEIPVWELETILHKFIGGAPETWKHGGEKFYSPARICKLTLGPGLYHFPQASPTGLVQIFIQK